MQTYKIKWKPMSPITTELQSDTIFGHLCWAIRYIRGEEALIDLLEELKKGPVFTLSSAFMAGYLPLPRALPISSRVWIEVLNHPDNSIGVNLSQFRKKLKKKAHLPFDSWFEYAANFNWADIIKREADSQKNGQDFLMSQSYDDSVQKEIVSHNAISRLSHSTGDDAGTFFQEVTYYFEKGFEYESYIKTDYYDLETLNELFEHISLTGFGKKKSIGRGEMEISVEKFNFPDADYEPNAWLTLSNMIPSKNDSINAYYEGFTKYPKLGGAYALTETPFKAPLFLMKPGAVFFGSTPPIGSLVNPIPDNNEVVQNLYSFTLPFYYERGVV